MNHFDDEGPKDEKDNEFAQMFEASIKQQKGKRFSVGDKIQAEILVMGKDDVYVSLGVGKDGLVHRRELVEPDGTVPYKVGDKIALYVTQVRGGEILLSPNPTSKNLADDLEDAFDMELPIEGRVVEAVNGGFRVQLRGKLAFCPISHMDVKRIEQPELYVGQRFEFMITKFEESGRNIVVSRRKFLEQERELNLGAFSDERKPGDVVPGRVTRLEKFGAFVEIAPGIDGLAHISEISWSRIKDPSEVLAVGQQVSAKILKIETQADGKVRIALSLKDSGEDPWLKATEQFSVGTVVQGKVEKKEPFGLFISIGSGFTGLLPKSRAHESQGFSYDKLKVGDEVTVQIAEVRAAERRISLQPPGDAGADDWKGYMAEQKKSTNAGGGFATLGDKLKASMEKTKRSK